MKIGIFEELLEDERIDHTRLSFDSLDHLRLWDVDNPMDLSAKEELSWETFD